MKNALKNVRGPALIAAGLILGLGLMAVSVAFSANLVVAGLAGQVGALLIATMCLGLAFDLWGREAFFSDVEWSLSIRKKLGVVGFEFVDAAGLADKFATAVSGARDKILVTAVPIPELAFSLRHAFTDNHQDPDRVELAIPNRGALMAAGYLEDALVEWDADLPVVLRGAQKCAKGDLASSELFAMPFACVITETTAILCLTMPSEDVNSYCFIEGSPLGDDGGRHFYRVVEEYWQRSVEGAMLRDSNTGRPARQISVPPVGAMADVVAPETVVPESRAAAVVPKRKVGGRGRYARGQVGLRPLVDAGTLSAGTRIFMRDANRETVTAVVEGDGRIRLLPSGEMFDSPSRAALAVRGGRAINGFDAWHISEERGSATLGDLRNSYEAGDTGVTT